MALVESVRLASPGADGMPRVWLASLRAHQGRPDDALAAAEAALVDPSSIRHPFAVGHGRFARWFAFGMLGCPATGLAAIEAYLARQHPDHTAARFRPFALNMQAWMLPAAVPGRAPAAGRRHDGLASARAARAADRPDRAGRRRPSRRRGGGHRGVRLGRRARQHPARTGGPAACRGVDRWWSLAERQVDVLAGRSGEHAATLRGFARRWLDAPR
ncbi:MAG: hypothetical protein DLM60_06810 [Pseudonocardiales bacterium]|nr:MAG: hypothetical protein DLM60_06810 [Pseudonocardiales bacterium]